MSAARHRLEPGSELPVAPFQARSTRQADADIIGAPPEIQALISEALTEFCRDGTLPPFRGRPAVKKFAPMSALAGAWRIAVGFEACDPQQVPDWRICFVPYPAERTIRIFLVTGWRRAYVEREAVCRLRTLSRGR